MSRAVAGGAKGMWYSVFIMDTGGGAKAVARWIALGALFLVPLAPLIIANSFFFPFITGKAFYFRILIEIAVAAWVVLAFLDKRYRPRFSWISIAMFAFIAWMFIADCFAVNASKAFWSNFERMEGWILLIHLLGFFVVTSIVLRVENKWRAWFLTSLAVSLIVSGYALLQLGGALAIHQGSTRIDATFGNSAYLAIYFLFNVFIALWLAWREKHLWLRWCLVALAVLEGVLIFFTETRGTILGLVGALALAAFLAALFAGSRARKWSIAALAFIVLVAGGFYLARNSSFIQGNHVFQRIASISLADGQTRFTIWGMALEGVAERPLVGWGQEGFNYVFNQFYKPSLYTQEPWFDRAHNVFIDWLVEGGIPAFLLYLALFASAIVLLWRSGLPRSERILLTAAFVGYAIHNLFVFDNLYSYVYFFAILAFIDSQVGRPFARMERASELSATNGSIYALPIAGVVALALIWFVNVPGMSTASELIVALTPTAQSPASNIATFEDLVKHPSFAAQEVREQLVSYATSVVQNSQATTAQKQQIVTLAIQEMQKQVAAYPDDARERMQLAYAYRAAGDSADAIKQIQAAIKLSPQKEDFWIELGAAQWDANNVAEAQKDFNTAYTLGPQFSGIAAYAAAGDIAAGDQKTGEAILQKAFGTTTVDSDILAVAYYRTKNWPRLITLWKLRATQPTATVDTWFSLAAAYYEAGDNAHAIATLRTISTRFPEASTTATAAIKQIENGTVGQ